MKPPHTPIRAWAGHHFLCKWKWVPWFPGTKVSGAFPRPYFSTHGTPFVKQLIIAKRNTLVKKLRWQPWIFKRPANNPVGNAKTVTSSEFPAYRGTKMKCIWCESPCNPPLRPEWEGGVLGFQMTSALFSAYYWAKHYYVQCFVVKCFSGVIIILAMSTLFVTNMMQTAIPKQAIRVIWEKNK